VTFSNGFMNLAQYTGMILRNNWMFCWVAHAVKQHTQRDPYTHIILHQPFYIYSESMAFKSVGLNVWIKTALWNIVK